jgi:protein transport protein SEC31
MVGCNNAFSEQGYLRTYSMDLTNPGQMFTLSNEVLLEEKFSCMAWGNHFNSSLGLGLVAGGMCDGSLMLWEAGAHVLPSEEYGDGMVCNMTLYGPNEFNCMEFNSYKKELLATGGSDVYIVNMEKSIEDPEVFCPNSKKEPHPITSVSWNKNKTVPHILASGSANGVINVWDLKVKRSTFSFRDKSQETGRDVKIAWNPNISSQIAVSFDDSKEIGIQIWDLRNSKAPVTILKDAHKSARINSLSWSTTDANLILSADRNGVVVCHDYKTGEVVLQETLKADISQVAWVPTLPSLFTVQDIEGNVRVHTTDNEMMKKISTTHAPKWMKNQSCVTTTMNQAIFYKENPSQLSKIIVQQSSKTSTQTALSTLADLVSSNDINEYISHYSKSSKDLWAMIQNHIKSDEEILQSLGFDPEEITTKTETLTGKSHKKQRERVESKARLNFEFTDMTEHQAEDFFNQLSKNPDEQQTSEKGTYFNGNIKEEEIIVRRNENWDAGIEDLIRRNLFVGNFHGAIDCAIKAGRVDHAFLIAYSQPDHPELMGAAAEGIALMNSDPVSKLLQNVIENTCEDLIDQYELSRWKEICAFIISQYSDRRTELFKLLGDRLEKEKKIDEALIVCLISRNYSHLFEILKNGVRSKKGTDLEASLIQTFTILYAINSVANRMTMDLEVQKNLIRFAHLTIENEHFSLGLRFLEELGDQKLEQIAFIKNCIYFANESSLSIAHQPPTYEFVIRLDHTVQTKGKAAPNNASGKQVAEQPHKTGPKAPVKQKFISASTRGGEDDKGSIASDMDIPEINDRMPPGNRLQNFTQPPGGTGMKKPPPTPNGDFRSPQPGHALRQGPPPKPNFAAKPIEEAADETSNHSAKNKALPPGPKKFAPPEPQPAIVTAPVPERQMPPPPKNVPPPVHRAGPPPPLIRPPPTQPPAPVHPVHVQAPPMPTQPAKTDKPGPPPKTQAGPPPPKPNGPPPPAQPKGPPPSVQQGPPRPGPPGPPPSKAIPVQAPAEPVQQTPPKTTAPPPSRAGGPPPRGPPPPANKPPGPPPAKQPSGPPTKQAPAKPEPEEEEETEEESIISGLHQASEFLSGIVKLINVSWIPFRCSRLTPPSRSSR